MSRIARVGAALCLLAFVQCLRPTPGYDSADDASGAGSSGSGDAGGGSSTEAGSGSAGNTADGSGTGTAGGGDTGGSSSTEVGSGSTSDTSCECDSGPCCDGCSFYDLAASHVCETQYNYDCSGGACGDDALVDTGERICQGGTSACTGSLDWSGWTVNANCTVDEGCETDDATYSQCVDVCSNETLIDLTPTDGTPSDDLLEPSLTTKGYVFTVETTVELVAFEWWINQPSTGWIGARLYDSTNALLATGTQVFGSDIEAWYRSDISHTLIAGQTYTLAFHNTAPWDSIFDFKDIPTQPFDVLPHFTALENRSVNSDVCPTGINYWAPFMRVVIAN